MYDSRIKQWGVFVYKDGNIKHFEEDYYGIVSTKEEHISESYIRDIMPSWIWDIGLDPRK